MSDRVNHFMDAVKGNDASVVGQLLSAHAVELKAFLDAPINGWAFGETPLIAAVRQGNREMIGVLLAAGADINQRSHWWAGGFGVLDEAAPDPALAEWLIERGAVVDAHAAARLGKFEHLKMLLGAAPELVNARAGDGMLPLHFAKTLGIAQFLVESCGADIDAIDVDHESTAAQYMIRDRQEIARYLVSRGCRTDLLMAAALGDMALVERHIADIRACVSPRWFPMQHPRAGGSIYMWTFGPTKTPHQIAYDFGHIAVFDFLMERTAAPLRQAVECELDLSPSSAAVAIDREDCLRIVNAAKSDDPPKVRRMLDRGWPVATIFDGATALHWAAFHGNRELVSLLLERGAPADLVDAHYGATPLGWAEHGRTNSWIKSGDYPAVMDLLRNIAASPKTTTPSA